ncbi:unnamed protein product [Periconia digitata]|uniref:Uncharacterized protein n=1 Tax=Periconia digitata TaxID=1303443 RepID=A0A9W4UCH7_9PLEO|nr:unnamed protein product [Periconia digitata]
MPPKYRLSEYQKIRRDVFPAGKFSDEIPETSSSDNEQITKDRVPKPKVLKKSQKEQKPEAQLTSGSHVSETVKESLPSLAASDKNDIPPIFPFRSTQTATETPSLYSRTFRTKPTESSFLGARHNQQVAAVPGAWNSFEPSPDDASTFADDNLYNSRLVRNSCKTNFQLAQQTPLPTGSWTDHSNDDEDTATVVDEEMYDAELARTTSGSDTNTHDHANPQNVSGLHPSGNPQERITYGFSYTTSFGSDAPANASTPQSSFQQHSQLNNPSTSQNPYFTPQPSFQQNPQLINTNTSFKDILVLRQMAGYSFHAPSKTLLPCTRASIGDTMQLRRQAEKLSEYDESEAVFDALGNRIERMVSDRLPSGARSGSTSSSTSASTSTSISVSRSDSSANPTQNRAAKVKARKVKKAAVRKAQAQAKEGSVDVEKVVIESAKKLRDWLEAHLDERVELGEARGWLEHEVEWANWFVEAAEKGVLHLKVLGCQCKPSWEDSIGEHRIGN